MADGASTFTDPDSGDLVIDEGRDPRFAPKIDGPHFANLADGAVDDSVITNLSSTITENIAWDQSGMEEWNDLLADNVKLLGVGPESQPDDTDDEYCDTSDHPLMLTALLRFQSKALSAVLPLPDKVCSTECAIDLEAIHDPDQRDQFREEADEAGERLEKFMADYLLKQHPSYRQDTDRILYECGMHGAGVRKVWTDYSRNTSKVRVDQIDISKLIISFDTKSMACGRITEVIDMPTADVIRNIQNGNYRAVTLSAGGAETPTAKESAENTIAAIANDLQREGETHRIYETHMDLFLDGDPHPQRLARPYIVTIHAASQEILSLRRNWQENDPDEKPIERYVVYPFWSGKNALQGLGLGHILANVTRALRNAQRRGLEASYFQNKPAGFKLSNMKIRDDGSKIRNGEFVDIDAPTGSIHDALMLQPFDGPSSGLIAMADKMEANGRELGGIASIDFSQLMKAGIAAGPAMAAYDESTEFQTAIHSRLYHAHATELRLIMDRLREVYGNNPVNFGVNSVLHEGDLTKVNLIPIMRPGQISRQRQILEAQAMVEVADRAPEIVDRRKAYEEYIKALGKSNALDYILDDPSEAAPEPADPITEYSAVLMGAPIVAGMAQNHQAHIDSHAAQMRMLQVSQLPPSQGEMAMSALAAHIAEHMGMQMMVDVAMGLGVPIEMLSAMPPELEAELAPAVAEQIVSIEEMRRPEEGGDDRVLLEQVKGNNALTLQDAKARDAEGLEALKAANAKKLQEQKDEAALERSEMDDETALEIANIKGGGPAKAGVLSQ